MGWRLCSNEGTPTGGWKASRATHASPKPACDKEALSPGPVGSPVLGAEAEEPSSRLWKSRRQSLLFKRGRPCPVPEGEDPGTGQCSPGAV